jgi:putative peptidoglycan lipid II flippase
MPALQNIINKIKYIFKTKSLQKTAIMIASFTLMSQLLSLFRDRLFASHIGAGITLDSYYYAFRIPDILFAIFTSLVSVTVLIPLLVKYDKNDDKSIMKKIYNILFSVFFIFSSIVIMLLLIFMPYLVQHIVAPGINDVHTINNIVLYSRLLLLQPFFLGLSNLLGSYTQMKERFLLYSLSPLVYNISTILSLLFLYPIYGIKGVIYGILFGSILHGFIQIPFIIKNNFLPRFVRVQKKDWVIVKEIITSSLPRAFILSLAQIEFLFFNSLASHAPAGNTSILNFANNLQSVPMALIGVSFVVAAFPTFSKKFAEGDEKEFWNVFKYTAKKITIYCGLSMIAILFLKDYIVLILLGNVTSGKVIALSFGIFSLSLVPQCIELLITRVYYARGENYKPAGLNIFMTLFMLTVAYMSDKTAVGIATAFTIGSWFSCIVFWISIRKYLKPDNNGPKKVIAGIEV